jgi:ribosomal protein S12 methylthiotransferase
MSKTYYIESLGCAKNLVDSEAFAFLLEKHGYEWIDNPYLADLILVNTCSFLQASIDELRHELSSLCDIEADQLWVTGCVMNRGLSELQEDFPEVDQWIGLKDFAAFERLLSGSASDARNPYLNRVPIQPGFHAYLRISDGCNNNCSYCTIPSIRGPLRSVPIEDLVAEAKCLAEDPGRRPQELVVIAQDTCSYGVDIYGEKALPKLLTALHDIPEFKWIRVMYMHPDHFDESWLSLWKSLPKLLPFFEIPIQHCHDAILTSMGRKKGEKELTSLFTNIRNQLPESVLRTTLMVGYPGETDAIFDSLLDFVRRVKFDQLGAFTYSQESGTPASKLSDQLPLAIKEDRYNSLMALQEEISEERLQQYIGSDLEVLIEDEGEPEDEIEASGRAWFQPPDLEAKTFLSRSVAGSGSFTRANIYDCDPISLYGE